MRNGAFFIIWYLFILPAVHAQRNYSEASVLAVGNWYTIAVKDAGVYKVDVPMLSRLGINTTQLLSATIRLYGNGGAMLPEACNGFKNDDLVENAITIIDGGDGVLNGNDYFIFYAPGPDRWTNDSTNRRFNHHKNLYSNEAYYFISIGGAGKRIQQQPASPAATASTVSFSERWFHELDTINLLQSGKDWYGEELSALPGMTQSFNLPLSNNNNSAVTLVANCAARSVTGTSRFTASINGATVWQQDIAAVGSTSLDVFARTAVQTVSFNSGNSSVLTYKFSPGGANAQGWIDWLEVFYRSNLAVTGNGQLLFRDWNSVAPGNIALFTIQNAAAAQVWDVTDITNPVRMNTTVNGSALSYTDSAASLHEYVCFSNQFLTPVTIGKTDNQNLHHSQPADLLVVCYPPLLAQAQRIALFHQQHDNLKTVVVNTTQVYNEFSSGTPDPVAIRDFVKMYYDKAGKDSAIRPKYLLLMGDASFDYKNRLKNNSNFVPAYESSVSLDPLSTYASDDFFGFLDDHEDVNSTTMTNLLDIGIGRIPAQTPEQAKAFADKLVNYTNPKSLGPWRNQQTFIADDQDLNLHINDAENITSAAANPLFIQNKIYLDAYAQDKGPLGSRYPGVNTAIGNQVQEGSLIMNYNGHGSSNRLAEEVILDRDIIDTWNNPNRLPLLITATCDFAPYDNPGTYSLGEYMLLRQHMGAIALMTTTRLVFAYSNRVMNRNYLQAALQPRNGVYPTLGEAVMRAKNLTYTTQSDIANNRKFTLLGDPALTLAYPRYRIQTTTINGKPVSTVPDTLKPLAKYSFSGNIIDALGNPVNGFNGTVYATVYDKPQQSITRANDPDSYPQSFAVQGAVLFKGKATVVNGQFSFGFIVPKDIQYPAAKGTINLYAENGELDGNGFFNGFIVGGAQATSNDTRGPDIKAFITDEHFINGNAVPSNPVLLLQLSDSSGINIAGTATGHALTAVVDADASQSFVLNSFFEPATDSYQQGTVRFQMPEMEEGVHTLTVKAWDVNNNSNSVTISFRVLRKEGLKIFTVINYPNPFANHTRFVFEHNRPYIYLNVSIRIFETTGKLVKTIQSTINTTGTRSSDIDWDGKGNNGETLAPGIYIYQAQVTSATDGQTAAKTGKLMRQ